MSKLLRQPIHDEAFNLRGAVRELNKTKEDLRFQQDRMALYRGCNGNMIPEALVLLQPLHNWLWVQSLKSIVATGGNLKL
ncbi:hypothetical protein O181_082705 [Austropuccinia psidii MF-1]|uniref:Uncharacterized protein n=1 Tax=Austropuccinia psidii MF-1 TaxID=1389203 RepID=A0A9Q3FSE1_9BASI|nr:hypothetical protein [Austropuccinia psidii MF-1]